MGRYPIKLGKQPLIDAVFEIRFTTTVDASVLLPGYFYAALAITEPAQKLGMDVPDEVLQGLNPNFAFQPKLRLSWNHYNLLLSPQSLVVSCPLPYPGWAAFRKAIAEVVAVIKKATQISAVTRYSMRYVDHLAGSSVENEIQKLNLTVNLAGHGIGSKGFGLRLERDDESVVHVFNIAAPASALIGKNAHQPGVVVDVDSSVTLSGTPLKSWVESLEETLDVLHMKNKRAFFDCLTDAGIESLEPTYES